MANSVLVKLFSLVLVCIVVSAPHAEAGIRCQQVGSALSPCIRYLQSGGSVPPACCSGVRSLNAAARTTPDRQKACACLRQAAAKVARINYRAASSLPQKCGVILRIGVPVTATIDCSKVK